MAKASGKYNPYRFRRFGVAGATIGGRPILFEPPDIPRLVYDARGPRWLLDKRPPTKRSRKLRKNRGGGPQRLRARVVLQRIWREEYPTRAEVSDVDAWDRFSEEYERIEAKAKSRSKYGKPSFHTVLREMGRLD
jgi:hypothetical protein